MLSDKDWVAFFNNVEIKKDLIRLACFFFKQLRVKIYLRYHLSSMKVKYMKNY